MPLRTAEEIHAGVGDFVEGSTNPDYAPYIPWPERWQIVVSLLKKLFTKQTLRTILGAILIIALMPVFTTCLILMLDQALLLLK